MRLKTIKTALLLFVTLIGMSLAAQPGIRFYSEYANNSISSFILKAAVQAKLQIRNNRFETGFRADLINNLKTGLSASYLKYTRSVIAGSRQLEFSGFIMNTPFSDFFSERDWGLITMAQLDRAILSAGVNFRSFAINKRVFRDQPGKKSFDILHESWNLLYSLEYAFIRTAKVQISVALSDFDDFSVSQMINPILTLSSSCRVNPEVRIFINTGLKGSGMLNTNLNYFGSYIKTGMTWNLRH
jgi:hypothetical protein